MDKYIYICLYIWIYIFIHLLILLHMSHIKAIHYKSLFMDH
uniref:ORF40o n=1 Tax=Pinus koraiensis TaxID=88728 RepID=A4QM81_PINKO|nr:ORF40o [Pinus koraiensis]ABP35419.1 ORF40o [Pinus koraiensis]